MPLATKTAYSRKMTSSKETIPSLKGLAPIGTAPHEQFLPESTPAEKTEISISALQHHDYFLRLKKRVEKNWNLPEGVRFSEGTTILSVLINRDGSLSSSKMVSSSGQALFDYEALQAVKTSAPFEPPPPELIGKDGKFAIRFSFHYLSGKGFQLG